MAANREERFLMRQRGAGTRQVQDISFQFALPRTSNAPLRPRRSGRSQRTPRPELAPLKSSRRTPTSTQLLQARPTSRRTPGTSRKTSRPTEPKAPQLLPLRTPGTSRNRLPERPSPYDIPRNEDEEQLPSSQPSQRDEQGSVTKRRKLGVTVPALPQPHSTTYSSQARATTTEQDGTLNADTSSALKHLQGSGEKKRKKRKSIGVVPKTRRKSTVIVQEETPTVKPSISTEIDTPGSQVSPVEKTARVRGRPKKSLPALVEHLEEELDHQENAAELPKSKTRGRPRKSLPSVEGNPKQAEITTDSAKSKPRGRPRKSLPVVEDNEDEEAEHLETAADPAESKSRRRKRRSLPVVEDDENEEAGHPKTITESTKIHPRDRPKKSLPVVEVDEDHEAKRLKTLNDLPKSRPRGRPRKSDAPLDVIEETQPIRATRAPTKNPKNMPRPYCASTDTNESASKIARTHADAIPITVHRLSHLQALVVEDDDQDILAGPAPFPKKGGVNAIDVLSQICREMIAKSMNTLQRGAQNEGHEGRKAEWKRKRKAVEMFGDELDGRLFQMTEALDNNFALSTRLKHASKEKIALREELLNIRRERETVALRTDEVRRSHAKASKAAQEDNDLNTMLHDIELAVQRGRAQQDNGSEDGNRNGNGLEVLMQDVAATVSSAKGPGLLERVKTFNAYLERAFSAMNSRA